MRKYELIPTDGRKSFYGKAVVMVQDDGSEILYSYGTKIIEKTPGGGWCSGRRGVLSSCRGWCSVFVEKTNKEKKTQERVKNFIKSVDTDTETCQNSKQARRAHNKGGIYYV